MKSTEEKMKGDVYGFTVLSAGHLPPHLTIPFLLSSSLLTMKAIMKDVTAIWIKHFICRSVNWAFSLQYQTFFGETQWVSNWFSRLLSMYSKTASVQSCTTQWEVRSLSIPFIHSLIQLEGNYRPPRGFKILVGFCSHQGASLCWIPLDCTGWCLYWCAVCKTPERAAENRRDSKDCEAVSLRTTEVARQHGTPRNKLLFLLMQGHWANCWWHVVSYIYYSPSCINLLNNLHVWSVYYFKKNLCFHDCIPSYFFSK